MGLSVINVEGKAQTPSGQPLGVKPALLLLAVSLAVLVPGTIGVSFVDRDEGWYAQVCREMLETGDWLVPRYLGEVWLAKPPLSYWLVTASFKLFGVGEWQGRLVPVLASTINVLLVGALASSMYGRRVGLWAGLLFITSGLPAVVGKMLLTDPVMLTCTLMAVLTHWRIVTRGLPHRRAILYWLAIGLGMLAKGPATLVFAGAFALALIWTKQRQGWLLDWRWWAWMPLAGLVAGPWYVYIARYAGSTLVSQFFWYEVFARIANTPHGHGGPPGQYLLLSLAGLLPWTFFVPGALLASFKQRRGAPTCRLLLVWLAIPWIILELIHSKLPHYVMPCYVPIAILLARRARSAWIGGLAVAVVFHVVAGCLLLPALEPLRLSRQLARAVNEIALPGDAIYFCGYDEPTVYFYLDQPARPVPQAELAETLASESRPVVLSVTERALEQIESEKRPLLDVSAARRDLSGINYVKMKRERIYIFRIVTHH